jgi:hypothetical protein
MNILPAALYVLSLGQAEPSYQDILWCESSLSHPEIRWCKSPLEIDMILTCDREGCDTAQRLPMTIFWDSEP